MPKFLTVKDAASLAGKSPSSIRRIIYPIIEKDQHPDRRHIQPTPEEVRQLRTKGENFAWRVSEELVRRALPPHETGSAAAAKPHTDTSSDRTADLISMLQGELDIKNQQIAQQMELIKGLNERLREGNILMGSLQQQLALPAGPTRTKPEPGHTNAKETTPAKTRSPAPAKKPEPKKSFFGRLFQ